ncbi:hypothetical protein ACN47E_000190 [Coniothyrium glycines]
MASLQPVAGSVRPTHFSRKQQPHRSLHVPSPSSSASEQDSEAGSNSESSGEHRRMIHRNNSNHRGGRGYRGGHRGSRNGNRTDSSSSGGSNGHSSGETLTRNSAVPLRHCNQTPDQEHRLSPQHSSSITPTKQQSSFTLNGHTIHETHTSRVSSVAIPSPPRQVIKMSSRARNGQSQGNGGSQRTALRPMTRIASDHWSTQQETKIRLLGLPKTYTVKDIHESLSPYGHIIRIEIGSANSGRCAWVIFQPPLPPNTLPAQQIRIASTLLRWEEFKSRTSQVPSPVDPTVRYYQENIIYADKMDFGTRTGETTMIAMKTIVSDRDIQIKLDLRRKELDIQFRMEIDQVARRLRFRLPFALLSHIYKVSDPDTGEKCLVIPFECSPQFYVQKAEGATLPNGRTHTSFIPGEKFWVDWNTWFRETDVVDAQTRRQQVALPVMNHKDTASIDIGRWTSYRIILDDDTWASEKFDQFIRALDDYGITIQHINHYSVNHRLPSPLWSLLQEEIAGTHPQLELCSIDTANFDDLFASQIHLAFPVRYQLEACLSNGFMMEHTITKGFLERLAQMDEKLAVAILEKVVDRQYTYYNPTDIFGIQVRGNLEKKVPSYCILQRSVIITPTMMHVATPVMETSNRIIRKYAADVDRFIRVKFTDEKTEGPLRSLPNDRAEAVFDRVRRAMKHGIVVAGRYYEFLAFGNSQFRENGAYFYAPTSSKSADDIRLSLGQFDHIKTVAKFGARLGQCFSTTRAMQITVMIREIADICRNGYNFTDGVGKISLFLAQMAAQELGLTNAFEDPPSLYQFRLGGCKGVLALDPNITRNEVHIRPSQWKFAAEYKGLEIIRSSALATPFFNRQIILVLSDLGVKDDVFVRKQQEMVNDYEIAMTDEEIALQKLRKHIDMNQTTITMAGMVLDGFMKSREPFLMSLLGLWRASTIKNLKEKARIAIEDGAFVLGCVDETATLEGHTNDLQSSPEAFVTQKLAKLPEIFIQVDDTTKKGHYKIIEGVCILARNPSLHPGDIRIVRAVNVLALHHLKNVVVLPQKGDRDLANMCSGGDLDGDDYMVLWDTDLIPRDINVPPMDFTPELPTESDGPITVADISEFFVTYMKNDSLGQIAHAHLAQADFKANGTKDDTCLALANLHSQAVDYPKSGIPAMMDPDLKPAKWPHFMEKRHVSQDKIYRSKKVLGQLYDKVELVNFKPQWHYTFDTRILTAFNLNKEILTTASEVKIAYDEALKRLMAKHGIRTEFEAWSVFVLQHNHESRDYKFAEEFGRTIGALKAQYKEECRIAAGVANVAEWSKMAPFIAAMYTVTAQEMEAALKECQASKIVGGREVPVRPEDPEHMPLISFPWLFVSELGRIATGTDSKCQTEPLKQHPSYYKKKGGLARNKENMSTVETSAGVTRYGELLNLDFSRALTMDQSASTNLQDLVTDAATSPWDVDDVSRMSFVKQPSVQSSQQHRDFEGSYGWKQDFGQVLTTREDGRHQEEQDGQARVVKLETKQSSAMERLLRLG